MSMFSKALAATALCVAFIGPAHAFDLKGLTDSANKAVSDASDKANSATGKAQSSIDQASGQFKVAGDTASLVSQLTDQLGVTKTQAAGGTAALLSMAKSNLSGNQFSGITDQVSGLTGLLGSGESSGGGLASSILGNVQSLKGVQSAFSALGMSPDMIGQFAPVILKFMGSEGVAGNLLGSLQSLWAPAA
ncbi:hypothetical protein CEK62_16535 [Alcanivorax sp. N3-2A]|nr:hypothetical protein CEK62_16535 [Alcanivorax sp. N3-2A]|tara:strand:- start:26496 stop:27068 length:573 start_codon:yes stop_codon:yes gene_type:complete